MSFVNHFDQTSDPATPVANRSKVYTKSDGLYVIDDGGTVTGPMIDVLAGSPSSVIVRVKTMSDFPTPVAGVITLVANRQYQIEENLTTSDRFVLPTGGSVNIKSVSFNTLSITYTGTGTMFTGVNIGFFNSFDIQYFGTSSGTFCDISGSSAALSQIAVLSTLIQGFGSLGTLDDIRPFMSASAFVNNDGFTLTDCDDYRFDECLFINTIDQSATFFTINAGTIDVNGRFSGMTFNGFAGESAFNISSGIGASSFIQIQNSTFIGSGDAFASGSLIQTEKRVFSSGNVNLPDSRTIGSFIAQGNDVATVIAALGVGESNYVDFDLGQASGSITAYATNGSGGTTVTTSIAHVQPNEKLLEITGSTSYNGQHEIFAITATTFDIDVAFVADDGASSWTSGAFAGLDIERWELTNSVNGTLKYIGIPDIAGEYVATISATASGGVAKRYKFRMVKDSGSGFTDGFAIPNEISNTISNTTFRVGITAKTNDLFKMQVANFNDATNITIDTVSVGVK